MRKFAAIAALAIGLTACTSDPLPTPNPAPAPEVPAPVITEEQVGQILSEISADLAKADAAADPAQLGPRIGGPAISLRTGEYSLAKVTEGENPVTPLALSSQSMAISATTTWPRVIQVVTTIPEGSNLPLLLTLVQQAPRDQFQLWSWVRLFPGVAVPPTTEAALGSLAVAADSAVLRMTPDATLAAYVDLIMKGTESEFAGTFSDDPARTSFLESMQGLQSAIGDAGTATQESVISTSGTRSIATHDGGAIVVGAIDQVLTVQRTSAGATVSVGPVLAYGGAAEVQGTLRAKYLTTVAFYVPPAGSTESIRVLGAEQVLLGVERDDSTAP